MAEDTALRILLVGASGRMGREIAAAVESDPRVCIVAGFGRSAHAADGILPLSESASAPAFDVAIDFSRPEALAASISLCRQRGAALLTGTTGLDPALLQQLDDAATVVPVLVSANFSIGIAVLQATLQRASALLPDWDCDIIEAHHRDKRDAPSGTALLLGAAVDAGRSGGGGRPVRYASLRCGDIVGEHCVQFAGMGERLQLVHQATDRGVFARGAIAAARRLATRGPGRYRLADLFLA